MKKIFIIAISSMFIFCSCVMQMHNNNFTPRAVNTLNSVTLDELHLQRKDYEILNTITADATVIYEGNSQSMTIKEEKGEFSIVLTWNQNTGKWDKTDFDGIARLGYLSNDYDNLNISYNPEDMARNIAIYRLINISKSMGADGVIAPVISTNAEKTGRYQITFKTTVEAKAIKLKTDK